MTNVCFSTLAERIEWLLKHPQFLELTGGPKREDKSQIVKAMQRDGLVSKKTYWPDVKLDDAIREAKIRWFAAHMR